MTTFAMTQPDRNIRLIKGEVVPPGKKANTDISRLTKSRLYRVKLGLGTIYLRAARVITRPSGRRERHLARYLVGVCTRTGLTVEVFLEAVRDLRSGLFRAGLALQRAGLKLAGNLARGLSPRQKLDAIW